MKYPLVLKNAGKGYLSVIENLNVSELGCSKEDIIIVIGDTARVPISGSSTASRGTSMVWHALQRMKEPFKEKAL